MLSALTRRSPRKSIKNSSGRRLIRELEKELDRKDKALAEAAALLTLPPQKKQILSRRVDWREGTVRIARTKTRRG